MSKKTILFDEYCGYVISAMAENGKLTEFNFEKKDNDSVIGNIYKGKVEKILPGMQAAFINCGLKRNCYLSEGDAFPDPEKYDGENGGIPPEPDIKEGDDILVQVIKAPVGKKGARVTAFPSFIGKHLIYMPLTPFAGVSRKITDEELRKNLKYSACKMKKDGEGLVFRTAAPYAKRGTLLTELEYLRNLYGEVLSKFQNAATGELLYTDLQLCMRVMRDTLDYDIEQVIVATPELESTISGIMNLRPVASRRPVVLHDSGRDMLEERGLSRQISELTSPRVTLDNGAHLIIEKTEALTVIDVNTGGFTGDDNLEQTVYFTNILAAREIARQVKLRNIGGIVVVDFIDMTVPAHRKALVGELERELKKDGAKCAVAKMSEFGLVEFTRKRTGASPISVMTRQCRHCKTGLVKSPRFTALEMRARLLGLYADGNKFIRIDLNASLSDEILSWDALCADLKNRLGGAEILLVPHRSYPEEQVIYHCGNEALPLPDKYFKLF